MDSVQLTYISHSDAAPESELAVLAAVYAFVLKCHQQKQQAADCSAVSHARKEVPDEPLTTKPEGFTDDE